MMIDIDMNRPFVVYEFRHKTLNTYYRGKTSMKSWLKGTYKTSSKEFRIVLERDGRDSFNEIILATFDDEEEAYDYEEFVVKTENEDPLSYNKRIGGTGFRSGVNNPHFGKTGENSISWGKRWSWKEEAREAIKGENCHVYNTIWIHNKDIGEIKRIPEDDFIPDGWVLGRPDFNEESKLNYSDAKRNTVWYYNPETEQNIRIKFDDDIPEGFIKGRFNKNKYVWYYDETNGRKKRFLIDDDVPDNYTKGTRSKSHKRPKIIGHSKGAKWYHNPLTGVNKQMHGYNEIPRGWQIGMCKR